MAPTRWPAFDLIFFDCDSTLSTIEGIDELARLKGKEGRVGLLTNKAMDGELDLADVYGKRLKAIKPTLAQLKAVEERYWETLVEDAQEVIAALQFLGVHVFIISGGLIDAVKGFGRRLGVDPARVRAVELEYNELSGRWWDYHEPQAQQSKTYLDYSEGPLTVSSGKSAIIDELAGDLPGRRMMIGDGTSDLATSSMVDLFVGYGGVVAREKVKAESEIFVHDGIARGHSAACSRTPRMEALAGHGARISLSQGHNDCAGSPTRCIPRPNSARAFYPRIRGHHPIMTFDAIIFDMDGLLVDSEPVWHEVEIELIESRGYVYTDAVRDIGVGMRVDEFAAILQQHYPNLGESPAEIESALTGRMLNLPAGRIPARPGADELIRYVAEREYSACHRL